MNRIATFAFALPLLAAISFAQATPPVYSADYAVFQGVMSPGNENPPTPNNSRGYATMRAHVVRDESGAIISGSVQFVVDYTLPAATNVTGLHIHNGIAGANGPVTINTGVGGATAIAAGLTGRIDRTAEVTADNTAGVATLKGMFDGDPSGFYVNMHTTEYPGGIFRSQLTRSTVTKTMGLMSSRNEVPANASGAQGVSMVTAEVIRDKTGTIANAMVTFDIKYVLANAETFTGFHIHNGGAGINGPVKIATPISGTATVASDPSGTGTLHYEILAVATDPSVRDVLEAMYNDPASTYINIHTSTFGGGIMRAQLRKTDTIRIPAYMLPGNEVPAVTGLNAYAAAMLTVNTLRAVDGTVAAAGVVFDVNYRFPGATTFTGLHIHNGNSTVAGPVTINTGLGGAATVVSDTGSGNLYRPAVVFDASALATLNSIITTPENQYVNIHTTVNPGGAVRSQLAAPNTATPVVNAIISAVSDPTITTLPVGGLISIYGTNMSILTDSLDSFQGSKIPSTYDGVSITIGGVPAPVIYLSPTLINAQVPFEAPLGPQQVIVSNNGQVSAAFSATVTKANPGIFFDSAGGIVVRAADFSLIRPDSPAVRGKDTLVIYGTGFGQTVPGLQTGQLASYPPLQSVAGVTATLGGQNLTVIYAAASPGFVGLYQIATNLPASTPTGNLDLTVTVNGVSSNAVKLAVQ